MKFSIRDLLWLTVLAAVLTAWGIDHWRQANRSKAEVTDLLKVVQFESEWNQKLLRKSQAPAPIPPKE